MSETVVSVSRIQREAAQAARQYSDINAACPYPWGSQAAIEFKREFLQQRARLQEPLGDADDDGPLCTCDLTPTIDEEQFERCSACGRNLTI